MQTQKNAASQEANRVGECFGSESLQESDPKEQLVQPNLKRLQDWSERVRGGFWSRRMSDCISLTETMHLNNRRQGQGWSAPFSGDSEMVRMCAQLRMADGRERAKMALHVSFDASCDFCVPVGRPGLTCKRQSDQPLRLIRAHTGHRQTPCLDIDFAI
jgi:hypothetical protein